MEFFTLNPPGGISFPWSSSFWYNGSLAVAYSDSITGQVKFIATPKNVYNRNFDTVTNGYDLIACNNYDKYSVVVIPSPANDNKFFIIHQFPPDNSANYGLQTRCQLYTYMTGYQPGVRYSVLDMNYNNGLGKIVSKNNGLWASTGKFAIIRHQDGVQMWLVSQSGNSKTFYKNLFTQSGTIQNLPADTVSFPTEPLSSNYSQGGEIEASPQGDRIAVTSSGKRVNLYHFNKTTGTISFDTTILLPDPASQLCFSPDGSKLYVSTSYYGSCGSSIHRVYQVDMTASDRQGSVFELFTEDIYASSMEMQRIPGNRIMVRARNIYPENSNTLYNYYLLINPNQPKSAANVLRSYFTANANHHIPLVPNDVVKQAAESPVQDFGFPKDTAVCLGTYTITAPAGFGQYRWNTGETTQSITVSKPGTYAVNAGPVGFLKPSGYGYTRVRAQSQPLDLGADTSICRGTNYQFNIPSNFTNLLWHDGDTSRNRILTGYGGKQVLKAVDANGCLATDSVCVIVKYFPNAQFPASDTTLCAGESLTLYLEPLWNPAAQCLWQDGSTRDMFIVTSPGKYWGRVSFQGCTSSDTIVVNYRPSYTVNIGKDTTLCQGQLLTLTVPQTDLSYYWNTGATTRSIVVNNTGRYIVRTSNGSCTVYDTIYVTFTEPVQVNLGDDLQVCPGQTVNLNSSLWGSYLWSTGSTNSSIQVTQPGTYWLQVTRGGCITRDTIVITHSIAPVIQMNYDAVVCLGDTVHLSASGADSYSWTGNGLQSNTGNTVTAVPAWAGVHSYTVAGKANGCTTTKQVNVQVNPKPDVSVSSPESSVCFGKSMTITAYGAQSYSWSPSAGLSSTTGATVAAGPDTTTTYTITGISSQGCVNTTTKTVIVNPLTHPSLSISMQSCIGKTVDFIATAINGGPAPIIEWYVNNRVQPFSNPSLVLMSATNGTTVRARLISSATCATPIAVFSETDTIYCLQEDRPYIPGLDEFTLAPNPNDGNMWVRLKLNTPKAVGFILSDSKGRLVYQSPVKQVAGVYYHRMNLMLAAGVYHLRVIVGGDSFVEKVVVVR